MLRACTKCGEEKPETEFYTRSDGRRLRQCKLCINAYRRERADKNRERVREYHRAWRRRNPAKHNANGRKWARENPDKARAIVEACRRRNPAKAAARNARWKSKNHAYFSAYTAKRRARKLQAILPGNEQWIKAIYEAARYFGLTVDHVLPLQGKTVCGLHVPWNMQLLSSSRNSAKHNRLAA